MIAISHFVIYHPLNIISFVEIPRDADGGSCSPRLQTRGFSKALASKPSPLKRRATISARPGKRKTLHLRGCQQSYLKSKIHHRKYRQALFRSPREDKAD